MAIGRAGARHNGHKVYAATWQCCPSPKHGWAPDQKWVDVWGELSDSPESTRHGDSNPDSPCEAVILDNRPCASSAHTRTVQLDVNTVCLMTCGLLAGWVYRYTDTTPTVGRISQQIWPSKPRSNSRHSGYGRSIALLEIPSIPSHCRGSRQPGWSGRRPLPAYVFARTADELASDANQCAFVTANAAFCACCCASRCVFHLAEQLLGQTQRREAWTVLEREGLVAHKPEDNHGWFVLTGALGS
jgi:hypothetical protein